MLLKRSFLTAFLASPSSSGPPRDKAGTDRYAAHLPFQVFCCESGSHVIDPFQSYYKGITYRASTLSQNLSTTAHLPEWDPDTQCMDSTQMWFCRDLWTDAARGGMAESQKGMGMREADDYEQAMGGGAGKHQKRSWFGTEEQSISDEEKAFVKRQVKERREREKREVEELEALERKRVVDASTKKQIVKRAEGVVVHEIEIPDEVVDSDEDEEEKAAEAAPIVPIPIVEEPEVVAPVAVEDDPSAAKPDVADDGKGPAGGPVFPKKDKASDDDHDTNAGTNVDAMSESEDSEAPPPIEAESLPVAQAMEFLIPNSAFKPARIIVNPRCVTTYGGVSHTQLALDLFGPGNEGYDLEEATPYTGREEDDSGQYTLSEWLGPPDSFVCQEMRTTGGRVAPKSQRRVGFLVQNVSHALPILRIWRMFADLSSPFRFCRKSDWSRASSREEGARIS